MADQLDGDPESIDLRGYLAVIRRHKLLIGLTMATFMVVAIGYSVRQPKSYQAKTTVLLQSSASEDVLNGNLQQNPQYLQQLVQTELEVMRSRLVTDAVQKKLGYEPQVTVAAKGQTQVVVLRASDESPRKAVREADTYAAVYVQIRRDTAIADLNDAVTQLSSQVITLDQQLAAAQSKVGAAQAQLDGAAAGDIPALTAARDGAQRELDVLSASIAGRRLTLEGQIEKLQTAATLTQSRGAEIVSAARLPTEPATPNPKRNVAIAGFLGLLVGLALAFLRDHLDDSIRSTEILEAVTGGLPVLALVPGIESWRDREEAVLESVEHPNSPVAEAYRGLRVSIQFLAIERKLQLIQVTSSSAAEGKSTTATNLAVALARAGKRVVLVDCDLRRPRVHRFFDISNAVGFTSVLLRDVPASEALVPVVGVPGLNILPSGPPPPNPSELLGTRACRDLLAALGEVVDYVVIDSTPLLPVSDSVVLASCVDAVLVVASAGITTKRSLARSMEMLRLVDAPVVGAVLNRVSGLHGYGYGYGYPSTGEPDRLRSPKLSQAPAPERADDEAPARVPS